MKQRITTFDGLASGADIDLSDFDIPSAPEKIEKQYYHDLHFDGRQKEGLRYVECHFNNVTFEACHFRKLYFERCVMDNVQVMACNISELTFTDCHIQRLTLNGGVVEQCLFLAGQLNHALFWNSRIEGLTFNGVSAAEMRLEKVQLARWTAASSSFHQLTVVDSLFHDGGWYQSRLTDSCWQGGTLRRQAMNRCLLDRVSYRANYGDSSHNVWSECELNQVDWRGFSLIGACLMNSRAAQCDFSASAMANAVLTAGYFSHCCFNQAEMTFCQATDVQFIHCDFSGAALAQARLAGSVLEHCQVTGANFSRADMREMTVKETAFSGTGSSDGARTHGASGLPAGREQDPLLMRLDAWYQINQPGRQAETTPPAGPRRGGGSRYV